jgi:hypothetical protein
MHSASHAETCERSKQMGQRKGSASGGCPFGHLRRRANPPHAHMHSARATRRPASSRKQMGQRKGSTSGGCPFGHLRRLPLRAPLAAGTPLTRLAVLGERRPLGRWARRTGCGRSGGSGPPGHHNGLGRGSPATGTTSLPRIVMGCRSAHLGRRVAGCGSPALTNRPTGEVATLAEPREVARHEGW